MSCQHLVTQTVEGQPTYCACGELLLPRPKKKTKPQATKSLTVDKEK